MSLLGGLQVVQIGDGLAAAVCGRLLADVGTDITCIDPDSSTPLAEYLNHGKTVSPVILRRRTCPAAADLIVCEGQPRDARVLRQCDAAGLRRTQCRGSTRLHFVLRADRAAGGRSGDRSDVAFRQRHCAIADRAGGRSRRTADAAGGRTIRVYRWDCRRLRRHACGTCVRIRRRHRRLDPGSTRNHGGSRAGARRARQENLVAPAVDRRQRSYGYDPSGPRRLCGDLAARRAPVAGMARGNGRARLGRRPALLYQARSGCQLGCAA